MSNPWSELHSLVIYIIFGYTLLLPLVLVILKWFGIASPLQRLRLYLLAFLTPPVSFVLYHTILTKRCASALPPVWTDNAFHFLCIFSENLLRAVLPLAGLLLALGVLKAAAALLMIKRYERETPEIRQNTVKRVSTALLDLSSTLQVSPPRVILSSRNGFAAFTTGFIKPVIIINNEVADKLEDQELRALLGHELIHILHRDTIKSWMLHLVRDLTFINPMSSMLLKGYLLEKEALCDQKAARLTDLTPKEYAAALIKIWRYVLNHKPSSFGIASAFSGNRSGLERRVEALLKKRQDEDKMPLLQTTVLGTVLFIATVFFLGMVC